MLNSLQSQLRKTQKRLRREQHAIGLSTLAEGCTDSQSAKALTVCGPYPNRDKWRLVLIEGSERKSVVLASREEAERLKERMLDEARARSGLTIGQSLVEYRDYRIEYRGVKLKTADDQYQRLRLLLPLDLPVASLSVEKARRLYLKYANSPNLRNGKPRARARQLCHDRQALRQRGQRRQCSRRPSEPGSGAARGAHDHYRAA